MHDWRRYVRQGFTESAQRHGVDEQVVEELAGHLDDYFTALRLRGVPEAEAMRQVAIRAGDWEELRRGVLKAGREESMNDRVRQLWIPALVTLTLANVVLALLLRAHVPLAFVPAGSYASLCLYVPWILMLPLVGATGSFLARRGAAEGWKVYFVGLFPAVVLGGLFLLVLGFVSIFDRNTARHIALSGVLLGVTGWVVLPAIALLIGVAVEGLFRRSASVTRA